MLFKSNTKGLYNAYKGKSQSERGGKGAGIDAMRSDNISGREDVCVFSLSHGAGTSYLSAAISNFLSCYRKGKVSLVLNDVEFSDETVSPRVNVMSWDNESEAFAGSNFIVHDIGVYGELPLSKKEALQRGTIKIMLCKGDGAYMTKLAEYVEREEPEDIIYLFNQLPREWEKRVYELIDFTRQVYCIPTFFSLSPDERVVKVMEEMFK